MEATGQKPLLKHLAEFQKLIADYRPNAETMRLLQSTRLTLLVGPSSSGRDTVIRELYKTGQYYPMLSDNTRPPRINDGVMEKDGVEYWFRSEDDVLQGLKNGKYLEAEVLHRQQVCGTNITELETANRLNKIAITDVDIGGGNVLHGYKPDAVCIILLPPSFDEWLRRLHTRGPMPEDELRRRFETVIDIVASATKTDYYHFVVNRDLAECVQRVHELSNGSIPDMAEEDEGRALAEQLAVDVRLFLEQK